VENIGPDPDDNRSFLQLEYRAPGHPSKAAAAVFSPARGFTNHQFFHVIVNCRTVAMDTQTK
jgi:hypothetical protein